MLQSDDQAAAPPASREAVLRALDTVLDPELDEAVTTMGFIESLVVDGGRVAITFRLPTFWCSANFAFLMAVDMREAVGRVEGVAKVDIRLVDHFAARKINRGVAAGQSFSQAFEGEAAGELGDIRRIFRERAYLGRQERLLRLLATRWGVEAALALTMTDLEALVAHDDAEIGALAMRYLAMRRHDGGSSPLAFTTLAGAGVTVDDYPAHLRHLRKVRGTAEANAEMCRLYLQARITHPAPGCGIADRDPADA